VYEVKIDEALMAEVVRRLVVASEPERIILFGSRARGENRPDSDLDLLLVKNCPGATRALEARAYAALGGLALPVDILCYTPSEIEKWSTSPNHVISRAMREGRILYEQRR